MMKYYITFTEWSIIDDAHIGEVFLADNLSDRVEHHAFRRVKVDADIEGLRGVLVEGGVHSPHVCDTHSLR